MSAMQFLVRSVRLTSFMATFFSFLTGSFSGLLPCLSVSSVFLSSIAHILTSQFFGPKYQTYSKFRVSTERYLAVIVEPLGNTT